MRVGGRARVLGGAVVVVMLAACRSESERAQGAARKAAADTAKDDRAELAAYDSAIRAAPVPDSLLVRARRVADDLDSNLYALLFARLEAGGPARGIAVCADTAEARTARYLRTGVFVRRLGLRPRDPENLADSATRVAIARFAAQRGQPGGPTDAAHFIVGDDAQQRAEYFRPIVAGQRCQLCHAPAANIAPAIRGLLSQRWPNDSSPGYLPGELMGAVVVRFIVPRPSQGH